MTTLARFTNVGELQLPTGEIVEGHPEANPVIYTPEGTTNHFPSSWLPGLHGFSGGDPDNPAVQQSDGYWRVVKTNPQGHTIGEILCNNTITVAPGQTWTESFLYKTDGTFTVAQITFFDDNGHHPIVPTTVSIGSGVYLATATYTFEAGVTFLRVIDLYPNWGTSTYVDINYAQVEQSATRHPWTDSSYVAGSALIAGELQETSIENPMSFAPTATTNLLTDPSTLANHVPTNLGGVASASATNTDGTYHITFTKNGQGDYRLYSESITINKALAYVFSVDIKIVQTAQTYEFYMHGGAISTSQEPSSELQFAMWTGGQWVSTPVTGGTGWITQFSDGFTRISSLVPAGFFQGTASDIQVGIYGNWVETASTYEYYYRRPQIEQATQPSIWSSAPSSHARPAGSMILQRTLQEDAKNALVFDGNAGSIATTSYVAPALDAATQGSHTFEAAIIPSGWPTSAEGEGDVIARPGWHHTLGVDTSGHAHCVVWFLDTTSTNQSVGLSGNVAMTLGSVHTIACVVDTSAHMVHLYQDGQLVASTSYNSTWTLHDYAGAVYNLGSAYPTDPYAFPFHGTVRWVRVWNSALSQPQLQANYEQDELTGTESGLVGYWEFDESYGTTLIDKTGSGSNAIYQGGVARTFV